jgi:hypothetical protein
MSWKPEVRVHNDPKWYDNAIRCETEAEAIAYARDLEARWTSADAVRAVECADPVNGKWVDGKWQWNEDIT